MKKVLKKVQPSHDLIINVDLNNNEIINCRTSGACIYEVHACKFDWGGPAQ